MKKLRLFVLNFFAVISITANAVIDSGTCGDNITWTLDDDYSLTLTGSGAMTNYSYGNIPWISNRESIIKVTIDDGITSIGNYAFSGCSGLSSIVIPNSVTSIGEDAFLNCSLKSINLPNSVTSIGRAAFYDCSNLTSVNIPNSVTSIEDDTYRGCKSLTSVNIPNSVTSIERYAFAQCSKLTSVTIPNSVTNIGEAAFYGCSSLTSLTIPNSVTTIWQYAFSNCSGLTSVTIPNSVTTIGQYAFNNCSRLYSVNISSIDSWCNIKFINPSANPLTYAKNLYLNGQKVTSLSIPESVTIIRNYVFLGYTSLTEIYCLSENPPVVYDQTFDSSIYSNVTLNVPIGCSDIYKDHETWGKFTNILAGGAEIEKKVCEKPNITYDKENNKIIVSTTTDGAMINTTITSSDANTYGTNEILMSGKFTVTSYATKEGYENSETATTTFEFPLIKEIEKVVEKEIIKEVIKEVIKEIHDTIYIYDDTHSDIVLPTGEQMRITIVEDIINMDNIPINSMVYVYSMSGEMLEARKVYDNKITLQLPRNNTYIIKVTGQTIKIKI